jgi:hypothetical protein
LTKGLSNHPHVPYLNEKWILIVKRKVVGDCHYEVTLKRLTKLWWCVGSHFFHHIEISNLRNGKNSKPISKNLWFSNSIFTIFSLKKHQIFFWFSHFEQVMFLTNNFQNTIKLSIKYSTLGLLDPNFA